MKNLIKVAIALAVVLSVFGIFAFSSSASPDTSAAYAVWKDEESYLAGDDPVAISTSRDLSGSIGSNRFVLCYTDVTLMAGITVSNNSSLTIDLGGNTLRANSSVSVGANASYTPTEFTIRNGTVIHESAQFIKANPNSRVYFESVTIEEKATSLFYADGLRLLYFKDSKVIYPTSEKESGSIQIYPLLDVYLSKIAANEGVNADDFVYEHSVIFDNTQLVVTDGYAGNVILVPERADCVPHYSISFINGAGFNKLDGSFISNKNTYDGNYVHLNIMKGAAFPTEEVLIEDTLDPSVEVSYYNKYELTDVSVIPSDETSLALPDEVQPDGQIPKLIFGKSANPDAPYMLCNYLCDVTWVVNGVSETVSGYADGLTLANKQTSRGYYFKEDAEGEKRVYLDVHSGWSTTSYGEVSELVTVTEKNSTYYACFSEVGPAVLVEFSDSSMSEDGIRNAFMSDSLGDSVFSSVSPDSYLYLYEDARLDFSSSALISGDLTLDLGGKKLERFGSLKDINSLFNVSGKLTVKNGHISTAMTGIATLLGGEAVMENVEISFGTVPAFVTKGGSVKVMASRINGRSDSRLVPVFLLSENGGDSSVTVSGTEISVFGPVFTHTSDGEAADITAVLSDSEIKAYSLFSLYEGGSCISPLTRVGFTVENSSVLSEEVFDLPQGADGEPVLKLTAYVSSGEFSSDPRGKDVVLVLDEGKSIVYTGEVYTVKDSSFTVKYSMTLSDSFIAKFYIPKASEFVSVTSYVGETLRDELELVNIDGEEYYLFEISGISASDTLDDITVGIRFVSSGEEYIADVTYSPIDYFKTLLSGDDVLAAKLSAAAIRYITAVYVYSDTYIPTALSELLTSTEYLSAVRDLSEVIVRSSEDKEGNISEVFTSAQLYLSSGLSVRFNIKSGYTGDVTVMDTKYSITDGKVGELTYVSVPLGAVDMYRERITVKGDGILGEYSLDSYILALSNTDPELADVLYALRAFCYEAYVYDVGGVIPPYIPDTPTVDVEHRFP